MNETAERVGLTRRDCLRLLGRNGLGRVVFTDAAMPAVRPINYVLDGDDVLFRLPLAGPATVAIRGSVVGFQADGIDPTTCAGWTVLGVGQAVELADDDRRAVLAENRLGPYSGVAAHTFAVPLRQLTGQLMDLAASNRSATTGATAGSASVGTAPMPEPLDRSSP
jgi:nitroimidazol reductase NimA-like FMN-containing flavoprotein (pyridoxamine 5'-phosphate oxidase superfamily)